MDALVSVLFLGVVAGVWWWLAKRMKQSGRNWFLRHLAGSTVGLFGGLVVVAVAIEMGIIEAKSQPRTETAVSQPAKPTETPTVAPASVAAAPAEPVVETPAKSETPAKTLGLTPQQYADRLNTLLKKIDLNYRVDGRNVTSGEVNDVLNAPIGKHAALVAGISKSSGEVLDVVVMGAGDGTPASGLEIMMIASAALSAAADNVEFREVFQGLPAMIKGQDRTYGPVKLSAKNMDQLGTWFFASPIEGRGDEKG